MKTTKLPVAAVLVSLLYTSIGFSAAGNGPFSIVHHFDDAVQRPKATGVYQGQVYGITDYYFVTDNTASIFSFHLDGTNLRSRNILADISAFGPREPGHGPLSFHDGTIYGTDDLGRPYTANTSDLAATTIPEFLRPTGSWINPITTNDSFVLGGYQGDDYGIVSTPFTGGTSRNTFLSNSPVSAAATDGSTVFAVTLGNDPHFVGKLSSITATGDVETLRTSFGQTFSLAFYEEQVYGFGDEGLYRINPDGSGFELLKSDIEGLRIVISDDTIFGVTGPVVWNSDEPDLLFQINTDGSDYRVLHEFGMGPDNGFSVNPDLVVIGSTLYGSTYDGGENDLGTYYSFAIPPSQPNAVPEPTSLVTWMLLFCCCLVAGRAKAKR